MSGKSQWYIILNTRSIVSFVLNMFAGGIYEREEAEGFIMISTCRCRCCERRRSEEQWDRSSGNAVAAFANFKKREVLPEAEPEFPEKEFNLWYAGKTFCEGEAVAHIAAKWAWAQRVKGGKT